MYGLKPAVEATTIPEMLRNQKEEADQRAQALFTIVSTTLIMLDNGETPETIRCYIQDELSNI